MEMKSKCFIDVDRIHHFVEKDYPKNHRVVSKSHIYI